MIRAFTGPTDTTDVQRHFVEYEVSGLAPVTEVRTGAARGVDTVAAEASRIALPDARHVLYVPAAPRNRELERSGLYTVVWCPKGEPLSASYRIRNSWMLLGHRVGDHQAEVYRGLLRLQYPGSRVEGPVRIPADELVAFVKRPTFYRSGTWMTINIARRAGIRVDMRVLPEET